MRMLLLRNENISCLKFHNNHNRWDLFWDHEVRITCCYWEIKTPDLSMSNRFSRHWKLLLSWRTATVQEWKELFVEPGSVWIVFYYVTITKDNYLCLDDKVCLAIQQLLLRKKIWPIISTWLIVFQWPIVFNASK